jgi:ribosomal protein S25
LPQKKSLRKIEKQQRIREKESEKKGGRLEKTIGSLEIPDLNSDELIEQMRRMKAITPTGLAVQLNLKVSMAKKLLEELRKNKMVNLVSRSHNLKVYSLSQQ